MKRLARVKAVALIAMLAVVAPAVANNEADKDIVDTAVAAGSFKTLAAALDAADLIGALKDKGPYTVFAPTDDAFAKLPKGTVESLLKPENKDKLIAVLTYHVVAGKVPASKVVKLSGAKTLNGQKVDIKVDGSSVTVDKANVVKTDIECSNGIIHVIDSVILPASDNIPTTAAKAGSFKTLLAAAKAAGLVDALSADGPITVFAPTDEAFKKLPAGTVETLLKPENKDKLTAILTYHVVKGRVYSEDAVAAKSAKTLQGGSIKISTKGGAAMINNAKLVAVDIDASNGVIHVIDSVLLPPKKVGVRESRRMIESAIAKGARLYNAGHHEQCAEIYLTTVQTMVDYGQEMPETVMTNLKKTLTTCEGTHCPIQRSWALRHAMDHAYMVTSTH